MQFLARWPVDRAMRHAFKFAGAAVGPADAATSGNTITTFTVSATGTGLAITVPGTASLGTGTPGSTITAQLGSVQVTDSRAVDPAARGRPR